MDVLNYIPYNNRISTALCLIQNFTPSENTSWYHQYTDKIDNFHWTKWNLMFLCVWVNSSKSVFLVSLIWWYKLKLFLISLVLNHYNHIFMAGKVHATAPWLLLWVPSPKWRCTMICANSALFWTFLIRICG